MAATPQWSPMPFDFVPAGEVLAASITLPVLCIAIVFLRFYTRILQKQRHLLDDWLILLATFMLSGMAACLIAGYAFGVMGYPTPLPYGTDPEKAAHTYIESYKKVAKIEFAFQTCQVLGIGFAKLSVIFFCRRIFTVYKGSPMDWITITLIGVNVCHVIAFLLTLIFGCKLKVWLHWAPLHADLVSRYCGDLRTPVLAYTISDSILELLILVLPLPSIWALQISLGRKIGVTAVFLVGLMSVVGAFVRLGIYVTVLRLPYDAGYDLNQTVTTMLWWSMLQIGLAIIAACLPTVYFLRKYIRSQRLMSWRKEMSNSFSWLLFSERSNSDSEPKSSDLGWGASSQTKLADKEGRLMAVGREVHPESV